MAETQKRARRRPKGTTQPKPAKPKRQPSGRARADPSAWKDAREEAEAKPKRPKPRGARREGYTLPPEQIDLFEPVCGKLPVLEMFDQAWRARAESGEGYTYERRFGRRPALEPTAKTFDQVFAIASARCTQVSAKQLVDQAADAFDSELAHFLFEIP